MGGLKKVGDGINKLAGLMIVVIFSVMIVACVLQVFTRYVLNSSLSWTEELARFCFIWANMLGATICVSKGAHATVTVLIDLMPPKVKSAFTVLINAIVAAVSLVMVVYGCQVTYMTRLQTSPAIKLNMSLINAAVPLCGFFILVHAAIRLVEAVLAIMAKGGDNA